MLTIELLKNVEFEVVAGVIKERLESVSHKANEVGVEDAFLLLNNDGNSLKLINEAVDNGCRTIITDGYYNIENNSV